MIRCQTFEGNRKCPYQLYYYIIVRDKHLRAPCQLDWVAPIGSRPFLIQPHQKAKFSLSRKNAVSFEHGMQRGTTKFDYPIDSQIRAYKKVSHLRTYVF